MWSASFAHLLTTSTLPPNGRPADLPAAPEGLAHGWWQPANRAAHAAASGTRYTGLTAAAITDSPASFSGHATQEADLSRNLRAIRSQSARVGVVQSEGDFYVRDTPRRVAMLCEMLPSRVAAALVTDESEGTTGHSGRFSADYARKFSPYLLGFVTELVALTDCAQR
jgi:hypothetical protein